MARTRWQRRRAVATTSDQLRAVVVALALAFVTLDFVFDGIFPVILVVIAGSYVFVEGSYRASKLLAYRILC